MIFTLRRTRENSCSVRVHIVGSSVNTPDASLTVLHRSVYVRYVWDDLVPNLESTSGMRDSKNMVVTRMRMLRDTRSFKSEPLSLDTVRCRLKLLPIFPLKNQLKYR